MDGHDLTPSWRREGYVSLRSSKLRTLDLPVGRDELREAIDEDYSSTSYANKDAKLDEFHHFINRMQAGDLVCTASEGRLHLGTVLDQAEQVESPGGLSNLRREVRWDDNSVPVRSLDASVQARIQVQLDIVDMTQELGLLVAYADDGVEPTTPADAPAPLPRRLELPDATDEFAAALQVDRAWLQECVDLLRDRPQLIFYGPPGTGKTYIAQELAAHIAGDRVRLVQFHPGYSYEDFFEGYRPVDAGGFALKPGPFRKVVDAARENPSVAYVLIIDEINRGNLAKIFGELYFLLEYRDRNVDLLYATDDDVGFTLPANVFILGTMNTADRSIALVDAAMRRRFAFVSLHPSEPPISDVLRRWLAVKHHDERTALLLDELNRRIDDPDFRIGPSYFMRRAIHEPGGLERAWRTAILPLLEEHHYGDGTDVPDRYGLPAIERAVDRRLTADAPEGDAEAGTGRTDDAHHPAP